MICSIRRMGDRDDRRMIIYLTEDAVCRWRVESGRLKGIEAGDFSDFYLNGRAKNTVKNYGGAFKLVWSHAKEKGRFLYEWGEGEVAGLMVKLAREERGENMIKKTSAVINLLFEAAGLEEPTKGEAVRMVKKAAVKMMNVKKEKPLERKGTSLEDVEKMVEEIYLKMGSRAPAMRKQFLALQLVLFMGLRRFSDVNRILVKDMEFKEDGSLEIWMKISKTDQGSRGESFVISGERMKNGASVPDIVKWYLKALRLKKSAYVFCHIDQKGRSHEEKFITYNEARRSLIKEQIGLGLRKISLHSGRIGGASEAAAAGAGRAAIMKAGGWRSGAVDGYIRPIGEGQEVSRRLIQKLQV